MHKIRVFIDTCLLPLEDILKISKEDIEYYFSTVTSREIGDGNLKAELENANLEKKYECMVWDESCWDEGVWGGGVTYLEEILGIISNNSFPKIGKRKYLSRGQRSQLRDAMILENAIRDKADYFITQDKKAFLGTNNTHREYIENKFGIKILTKEEYITFLKNRYGR